MSSKRRAHNFVLKLTPVLLGAMAVFLLSLAARAATITAISDVQSRQRASFTASHTVRSTLPASFNMSGSSTTSDAIAYDFADSFSSSASGTWVTGDFMFNDGTARTVAAVAQGAGVSDVSCADGANNVGVAVDTASAIFKVKACGPSYASSTGTTTVTFSIDGESPDGTLTNPSSAGSYALSILMTDLGVLAHSGGAGLSVVDDHQVTVTASVGDVGNGGGGNNGGGTPNPPTISNVRSLNVTETEADVLWDTDTASSSLVNYGLTTSYGNNASTAGSTHNHSVHLSGLAPGTTYHYRVRSTDSFGQETISGDFTFTTPDSSGPVLSNIRAELVTGTSARIAWDTDEDTDARVDYGLSASYGSSVTSAVPANVHALDIAGLAPSTTYHYRVTSKDASDNETASSDFTFTTADTVPPALSNIVVDTITETSARVTWSTDELADSTVRYGLTMSYGSIVTNGNLVANHQITLTGLAAGTLYHFSVSSADAMANGATSTDQTFTTSVDATPPANVSNLSVAPGNEQNALSWTNPSDPDFAGVRIQRSTTAYPTSPSAGTTVYDGTGTTTVNGSLANGTTYYYTAFAYDNSGNFATGAVANGTPFDAIPPGPVSNFTVAAGDAQNALAWTNPADTDFSNVRIQRSTSGFPATPAQGTTIYAGTAESHLDNGLANGTTYYYAVFARDTSNNYSGPAQASGTPVGPPPPPPGCGNGACDAGEDYLSCPADCSAPPPSCGNAVCDSGEDHASCAIDCAAPIPPAQTMNQERIRLFGLSRALELHRNGNGEYRILPNRSLTFFIPLDAFSQPVTSVTLDFAASSYLFARTTQAVPQEGYVVDVSAPGAPALATGTVTATFEDGRTATARISARVEPVGMITHAQDGQQPLAGATVTLQKHAGDWFDWDALPYFQTNPVVTNDAGTFAFMAPPGRYRLIVQRDGYRTHESAPIDLATEVVAPSIELIALPPSITDVYIPGAPVTENIANVAKALGAQGAYITKILNNEVIHDPRVETTATQILVPAAAAVTTAVVATAVQATSIVSYLYFLLTQPLLLIGRRTRKGYGVVYNSLTKLPVDLASVRLYRVGTNRLVRTLVTDKRGRYAFIVEQGEYRIEVAKPGYVFPTRYMTGRKEDVQYLDLYHGENLAVSDQGAVITANIPLDPVDYVKSTRRLVLEEIGRRVQNLMAFSSVLISFVAAVLYRHLYLYILVAAQLLLYFLFKRLARTPRPKNWGIIYDEHTKKPIPFAVARIVETQYNKTLESRITDSKGRYNFLVGSNKYYVTVEKPGYETTKSNEIDLTAVRDGGGVVGRDIPMREKKPE